MVSNLVELTSFVEHRAKKAEDRAKKITDAKIVNFMVHYAENDRVAAEGDRLAGEIYYLYFKADAETQAEFIQSLCKSNHLALPAEEQTSRNRLIWAIYGLKDELVITPKGDHDSKGGKRITAAIRIYLESTGKKKRRKERQTEYWPRSTKKFLVDIREKATPAELRLLESLIARAYGKRALKAVA